MMVESKVSFEEFLKTVDWDKTDHAYWKEIFKGSWNEWDWNHCPPYLFKERWTELFKKPIFQKVQFVPFEKDGKQYLSEAYTLRTYLRRLRYVMRGNTIPSYGKDLKWERSDDNWWHHEVKEEG